MIKAALIATPLEHNKKEILERAERMRCEISRELGDELCFVAPEELKDGYIKFVFVASGGSARAFLEIFKMMKGPFVLITTGSDNSLAAAMEETGYAQDRGESATILHGIAKSIASSLADFAAIERAVKGLASCRMGLLGEPNMLINSECDSSLLERNTGIKTVYVSIEEVMDEIAKWKTCDSPLASQFLSSGFDREEVEKALCVYGAIRRIIDRYDLDAVALRCFDLIAPLKVTGCLALAMLNSEGIPASCEGDTRSLLSMIIARTLCGRSSFMANPSRMDTQKKEIVFAHCTLPVDMCTGYDLMTHFESGISVALRGRLAEGGYTVFKCFEDLRFHVTRAQLVDNLSLPDLCRTQVTLALEDVEGYLKSPLGNHQIIIPGDHSRLITQFFTLLRKKAGQQ